MSRQIDGTKIYTSVGGFEYQIIDKIYPDKFVEVKFIATGFIDITTMENALAGVVVDDIARKQEWKLSREKRKIKNKNVATCAQQKRTRRAMLEQSLIDLAITSTQDKEVLLLRKQLELWIINFISGKHKPQRTVSELACDLSVDNKWISNLASIRKSLKPVYHGAGIKGNPDVSLKYHDRAYKLWQSMMSRCYTKSLQNSTYYEKARVATRWRCFEFFLDDLHLVVGFDLWKNDNKMQLDKDLLGDFKIYSLTSCCFLSPYLNASISKETNLASKREQIIKGGIPSLHKDHLFIETGAYSWVEFLINFEEK